MPDQSIASPSVGERLAVLATKLDHIQESLNKLDHRFGDVDQRIADLDRRKADAADLEELKRVVEGKADAKSVDRLWTGVWSGIGVALLAIAGAVGKLIGLPIGG